MNNSRQPLFKLAWGSMRAHKWINAKLCLVFAILSVLICLFTSFHLAIENRRKDFYEQNVSSNYFYGENDRSEYLAENGVPDFEHVTLGRYDLSQFMLEHVGEDVPTVTSNFVTLVFYNTSLSYSYDKNLDPQLLWLYKLDKTYATDEYYPFTKGDVDELKLRFGVDKPYIGELPTGRNDALVSEKMLNGYGLRAEDVLGKNLSIRLGENGDVDPNDYMNLIGMRYVHITGVIVKEYYELSGHSGDWQIRPTVIFSADNGVNLPPKTLHLYVYDKWNDVSKGKIDDMSDEAELNYCGIATYSQRAFLDDIKVVVENLYAVIGSVLIAGLVLTVMLMMNKFVAVYSRTGGILLSCGLRSSNLYRLLWIQIVLMFFMSLPLALIGSVVGYAVITELVAIGTRIAMELSTGIIVGLLALSVALVFAISMLFYLFAVLRIRRKTVQQLLKTEIK